MTEVMQRPFRPPGAPALAVNGAPLRFTPGPGELRLPSCEDEPVPQNTRQLVAIERGVLCLCTRPPCREPLDGSLCWYDPAAGAFLPPRHELADDIRRLTDDRHQAAARRRRPKPRPRRPKPRWLSWRHSSRRCVGRG